VDVEWVCWLFCIAGLPDRVDSLAKIHPQFVYSLVQFVRNFTIDEVCFCKYSYFRKVVIFCSGTEFFV